MTRRYELVYVVSPDATDEQVAEVQAQVEGIIQKMGGTEALGPLPRLLGAFRRLRAAVQGPHAPAALVVIDFPEFNLRLARVARRAGIPVAYFIPPQVWAWRPWRVRVVARRASLVLAVFPFEPALYRQAGARVEFVGHPVLDALGISSSSLHPGCPMQVMVKGGSRLLIGLQSASVLDSLRPQMDQLVHLTPHVGADGFFVFAMLPSQDGVTATESRMFCPVIGVPEDPVSGNAHGMLGVYLVHNGLLAPGKERTCKIVGHQGRFVDRPGRVDVEVTAAGRRATAVRVTGHAVVVFDAELPV